MEHNNNNNNDDDENHISRQQPVACCRRSVEHKSEPTCEQKVVLCGDWGPMKKKSPCGAQTDSRPLCGGNTLTGSDRDQWFHHRTDLYCKQQPHRTQEETIYWPTLTAYWKLPTFITGTFVHSNTVLKERAIWQALVVQNQTFSKEIIKTY